jgi:signal transduction histidine kinase
MNWLTLRNHPLRFLLYLEWSLLGLVAFSELLRVWFFRLPRFPVLNLFCLVLFFLMGLALPQRQTATKVVYTAAEFFLVLVATLIGGIRLFPLMYIVLVMRNCFVFQGRSRLVVTGLVYALFILTQSNRFQSGFLARRILEPEQVAFLNLGFALVFGLVILFAQMSITAVLAEKEGREKLAIAHEQLRAYALKAEDIATLKERNRVARELHDSLGHSLTTFNLHLEAALRLFESNPEEARELLAEAKQLASSSLQDVRQSVAALRSDPLANQSLEGAIASLVAEFQRATNLTPKTWIYVMATLPSDVKTAIYRILQESLTNIAKYAEASSVKIHLKAQENVQLVVQDNGNGFDPEQNTTGFGLQGMRERTYALGGELFLETAPGRGCKITVHLPLRGSS